jgi:dUTP pyrophosphatase
LADSNVKIKLQFADLSLETKIPEYATEHSSGLDLASSSLLDIVLLPMETKLIPTNLIIEIPVGFEGQIRPRSGLAIKHNIGIINSPGTIDADYRGELKILLTNFGREPFTVRHSERIAQLVICKVEKAEIQIETSLSETKRSGGGFGHTGK